MFCTRFLLATNNNKGRCFFFLFILRNVCSINNRFVFVNGHVTYFQMWFHNRLNFWVLFELIRALKTRVMDENRKNSETASLWYERSQLAFEYLLYDFQVIGKLDWFVNCDTLLSNTPITNIYNKRNVMNSIDVPRAGLYKRFDH